MGRRLLHDDQKDSGLLPVLARLVKGFSHRHQPRSHAGDLVECIHVVLRLLDRLCQCGPPHTAPFAADSMMLPFLPVLPALNADLRTAVFVPRMTPN